MDIAKLVLEYVTVFLSWPVVFGLLVAYFLMRHRSVVDSFLARANKLSFSGVTLEKTEYPSAEPSPVDKAAPSDSGAHLSRKTPDLAEQLDKDFTSFLWHGISLDRLAVGIEIDRLWQQLLNRPFPPTILTGSQAQTHAERLRLLKDEFKIDERAIQDFNLLEGLTKDTPRPALVQAYGKSQTLKTYLSKISPSMWKS